MADILVNFAIMLRGLFVTRSRLPREPLLSVGTALLDMYK